jgi:integrase
MTDEPSRRNPRPAVNKLRLTKSAVAALPPPPEGKPYRVAWDAEIAGFGCRVLAGGRRTYFWQGRTRAGRAIKVSIGREGRITAEQARKKARELVAEVELGGDPAERRKSERQARRAKREPERSVADLWRLYCERHLPGKRQSSQDADCSLWRLHLEPAVGRLRVAALTREQIEALHREVTHEHGPYAANRCLALFSTLLALAERAGWCPANVARGVRRNPEHHRERFLTPEEIRRLLACLEAKGDLASKAVEFLLLTGARRGEALGATWAQLDLAAGVWVKPRHATKSGKLYRVPLSAEAVAVLADLLPTESGPFTSLPSWQLTRSWQAIRQEAGLTDVRLHDLRHSYASLLASAGLSLPVIGALLGHSQPSTTARYAHLLDDALREATAKAGALVRRNGDNVVALPVRRGGS